MDRERGGGWSGDLLLAGLGDIENHNSSEICGKRFQHKELIRVIPYEFLVK